MAICAFLLLALTSLIHLAVRADRRTQDLARRTEVETRLLEALARDLRPALRVRGDKEGAPFVFAGSADAVRFAVRDDAGTQIRLVTLQAEAGRIRRTSAPLPPFASAPGELAGSDITEGEIETGGNRVRFGYVQSLADGGEIALDSWTLPLAMPSAVSITLEDTRSGASGAALRVPLMIDAEPGCAAPSRARCAYRETGEADLVDPADLPPETVDAADPLGWARYAR